LKRVDLVQLGTKVELKTESMLGQAQLAQQLGLLMACGGKGLCATCHVVVDEGDAGSLSPMTDREERALQRLATRCAGSRLACQAMIRGDVKVRLPEGEYVDSLQTLEKMLGKRAQKNILHPATGQVLIAEGQIISKFVLKKLEDSNFRPWERG
jgi:ferredoxin